MKAAQRVWKSRKVSPDIQKDCGLMESRLPTELPGTTSAISSVGIPPDGRRESLGPARARPVLIARDIAATKAFCLVSLGFSESRFEDEASLILRRDAPELHFEPSPAGSRAVSGRSAFHQRRGTAASSHSATQAATCGGSAAQGRKPNRALWRQS